MNWKITVPLSLVKRSMKNSLVFVGAAETVMAITGISLADLLPASANWLKRLLLFIIVFLVFSFLIMVGSYLYSKNGLHVEVGGTDVVISVGDLFKQDGLKVIPFDEWFDTQVDDKIISSNSLNGIFITKHADKSRLENAIANPDETTLDPPEIMGGQLRYPLGTVKIYDDYALLAFTHMDKLNQAYLSHGQYEKCLFDMWAELNRVYSGRRIALPLLGSGISRFERGKPTEDELLRCMLCTLRASGTRFRDGIEIVLTRRAANCMHLYEVNAHVDGWNSGRE